MRRRYGMKPPRERGRPARKKNLAQPRHGSASDGPMRRVAGCSVAGKLSGNPRDRMRAGRPRSRGVSSRWCGGGYPVGDFSESRRAPFGKPPFARSPRRGRSIEKDHPFNIDAQDVQDNQDGRLLRQRLAPAMIACGFTDVQEYKPAVSKNPVHPVHRCESRIYLCLTMNRFPATRRRGFVSRVED